MSPRGHEHTPFIQRVSFVPYILYKVVWDRPLLGECQIVIFAFEDEDNFIVADIRDDVCHIDLEENFPG